MIRRLLIYFLILFSLGLIVVGILVLTDPPPAEFYHE